MKRLARARIGLLAIGLLASSLLAAAARAGDARPLEERTESFGRFGTVHLYRTQPQPARVALFLSGDGGWNQGVVDMARRLASLDALVIGIDVVAYRRALASSGPPCAYPAGELEALSQFAQRVLGFTRYERPVLVGYSAGATLAYAALAQAPANTFRGALSLGFCADLEAFARPLCPGDGLASQHDPEHKGVLLSPAGALESPWIVLQGRLDTVCPAAPARGFVEQTGGAELHELPRVGHGFGRAKNWAPQFREAFLRLSAPPPLPAASDASLSDLPLVEVPPAQPGAAGTAAAGPAAAPAGRALAVIVSGDGGWAGLDRAVARSLAARGIPVVGLDSLQYFWTPRTPEGSARDLERILAHYTEKWQRQKLLLIGYSRGAGVLPFMINRLPEPRRAQIGLVSLLDPGPDIEFQFQLDPPRPRPDQADADPANGARADAGPAALPVAPEVEKLRGLSILCVYDGGESDSLCPVLPADLVELDRRSGGHLLGGDYGELARSILAAAGP